MGTAEHFRDSNLASVAIGIFFWTFVGSTRVQVKYFQMNSIVRSSIVRFTPILRSSSSAAPSMFGWSRRSLWSSAFSSKSNAESPLQKNQNMDDVKNADEQILSEKSAAGVVTDEAMAQSASTESDESAEKIADLQKELKEMKDHYLRSLADSENLRERTKREKDLVKQLSIKSFAVDLLSVADILELALKSVPESARHDTSNPHLKNLYEGLNMTHAELMAALRRHGVEHYDALGQKFDPNIHQAMFQAPVEGKESGTVFNVTKSGYLLKGVVIRAAQVGIVQ